MSDFEKYSSLQPPTDLQERIDWLANQEERLATLVRRKLVSLIVKSTEAFINTLTAAGDMSVFDTIPLEWNRWVDNTLLEEVQGMYLAGGVLAWESSTASDVLGDDTANLWIEVVNQDAVEYAKVAQNRMRDVGMTAWNDIKNKVSKSIETGSSVEDLKGLLEKSRSFSEYRADTIARTETLNAFNNGNWTANQALGEYGPTHKYWVNTGDARSRETHNTVGSQPAIPINNPFSVGGEEMMYPHSPGASAKNVVNCRCTYGVLWPGDIDPNTGNPVGEVLADTDPQVSTADIKTGQFVELADESPFRPARYKMNDFDGSWRQIMDDAGGFDGDRGPNGDGHLIELWKRQGFTAKPRIVSATQLDSLVDEGWTLMHRGISADDIVTVDQYVTQFIDGDIPYAGKGLFGNGTYTAASRTTAEAFTKQTASGAATNTGQVIDMALHPDARIIDFEDIWKEVEKITEEERVIRKRLMDTYDDGSDNWSAVWERLSDEDRAIYDDISTKQNLLEEKPSNWATANGYDAIRVVKPRVNWAGGADDYVDDIYYIILNRGALAVKEIT